MQKTITIYFTDTRIEKLIERTNQLIIDMAHDMNANIRIEMSDTVYSQFSRIEGTSRISDIITNGLTEHLDDQSLINDMCDNIAYDIEERLCKPGAGLRQAIPS